MSSARVIALPVRDPRIEQLQAVVRPEFRVDQFRPPAGHFLAYRVCQVGSCPRDDTSRGMCNAHRRRWRADGQPPEQPWMVDPAVHRLGWDASTKPCRVPGCRYSGGGFGLCDPHRPAFLGFIHRVHGQHRGIEEFIAIAAPATRPDTSRCRYPGCQFDTAADGLCDGHRYQWQRLGKPPVGELAQALIRRRDPGFSLDGLVPLAQLEFQYLLQVRTDERLKRCRALEFNRAVRAVATHHPVSLRDHDLDFWLSQLPEGSRWERGLIRDLFTALAELDAPADEFSRDVWRPSRLGYDYVEYRNADRLDFTAIVQPWLREKVKAHTRLRMARMSMRTVTSQLRALRMFSRFLAECRPERQHDPAVLDRPLLEAYLPWLRRQTNSRPGPDKGKPLATSTIITTLSPLSVFLATWHRYQWQPPLPDQARLHPEDFPRRPGLEANFIDEALMEQIESVDNLALLGEPAQTLLLICRDEGLRIGEALTLPPNCLKRTKADRWALVHYKTKDQSWRAIPASALVVAAIQRQARHVKGRYGPGCRWLFPRFQKNPDGAFPVPYKTATGWLQHWLLRIRLVDTDGNPARVSFHQFRHTLGTRMANAGVAGRTIREVLGHTSWEMQEHYSRIADETLRREYEEKYEFRFNLKGEAVRIRPDADLAGVQWMAEKLGHRLHAVSGGWCGRHVSRPCPKSAAEGCYSCSDFQTDSTFLPIHADTLQRTSDLQAEAEAAGRSRVADINKHFAGVVSHLIEQVTADEQRSLTTQQPQTSADADADQEIKDAAG